MNQNTHVMIEAERIMTETEKVMFTEKVYKPYYGSILYYVSQRLNSIENAKDLTHDIFRKAMRLIDTYSEDRGAISTWIFKIASTGVVDYFRTDHQDRFRAVSDFVNADGDEAFQFVAPERSDKILEAKELKQRIESAVNSLKPEYRKVATYYFFKEYKYEEIAEEFGMKLGTVKAMISRCRAMLKKELKGVRQPKTELV